MKLYQFILDKFLILTQNFPSVQSDLASQSFRVFFARYFHYFYFKAYYFPTYPNIAI